MNSKIIRNSGWWILSILSLAPLLLWLNGGLTSFTFSNLSSFSRGLGNVLGLCGMAMFSLVMILSARLRFFEKFFNGINESYTAHHFFGGLAFCVLLFHPLLLAYNYLLVSFNSAAMFLLPGNNLAQNSGIFGLLVMIITLAITFYAKLKYQVWKFTHKSLGIAFIFAFLHTFMVGADLLTNKPLKLYLLILGILALITYFYRTLFADYFVRTLNYSVADVKKYEDKIWEITLNPNAKEMKFIPGQFAFVKIYSSDLSKEAHPFSFSSANGNPFKIAIKELGDYTNKISGIKNGDLIKIEGPFGAFNFKRHAKKQVWIAGGIGVTPFLSMARGLSDNYNDYKIDLYYSVKDENCFAFKNELEEIGRKHSNLKFILWNSKEKGFLKAESIKTATPDLNERDILVCGPAPMMKAIKTQFLQLGVKTSQIHTEEFSLY